ncbi:ABC transporter substrate-binding protein [Verrucosispora sioxanthis]|uniref:ABC transporter substrate-binding protein n=1 Tax=Verrucosispora sioxanthis TaxID=2499994 RepID=UPI0035A09A89
MATPATGPSVVTRRGVLAAAAGTLLLGACGRDGGRENAVTRPTPGHELVVGATLELSGPGAALGVLQQRALAISAAALNEKGVAVGNLRRTVRVEVLDNRSNPRLAAQQATELGRRDDVHALLGATLAETSMSVIGVAQKLRLPFVSLAFGDSIAVPLAQRTYVYKVTPDAGDVARRLAQLVSAEGLRQVVLLAEDGLHGDSGVRAMRGALRTAEVGLARTVRLPTGKAGLARAAPRPVPPRGRYAPPDTTVRCSSTPGRWPRRPWRLPICPPSRAPTRSTRPRWVAPPSPTAAPPGAPTATSSRRTSARTAATVASPRTPRTRCC